MNVIIIIESSFRKFLFLFIIHTHNIKLTSSINQEIIKNISLRRHANIVNENHG